MPKQLYCDVYGTLIGGPHDRDVMLQALQDVSPPYIVQLVSSNGYNAERILGGVSILDKADVIRTKNLDGVVWIDDEDFLLRALTRRGVTAIHVDDALEFLASIRRPPRENALPANTAELRRRELRRPCRTEVWWDVVPKGTQAERLRQRGYREVQDESSHTGFVRRRRT